MRIGIENKEKEIFKILDLLTKGKHNLFSLLISLLENDISSSDLLFLILEELERRNIAKGEKGEIEILNEIKEREEIKNEVLRKILKSKKIFLTPLEIAKFYLCPRRLWLEKVVLAKQEKERKGNVWNGELVHFAAKLLFLQFPFFEFEEIVEKAMKNYEDKTTIQKNQLISFLKTLKNFLEEEKFEKIFPEKIIENFKIGLIGRPDAIAIKNDKIFPINIKLGRFTRKKEHLLQIAGEALIIQHFFRKLVKKGYLISFESNSIVPIDINQTFKRMLINYKKRIEKMLSMPLIPRKSNLQNFEKRVCLGCHVKKSCELIERFKKMVKIKTPI